MTNGGMNARARTKGFLVALLLAFTATAVAAPPCWACSCVPMTKKEQAKSADVVFTGRVQKVSQPDESPELKVRFRVRKVYKGHPKEITRVYTSDSGAMCGAAFEKGKRYTVFADWSDGKKWTSSCSGTKQGPINPNNYGLPDAYPPKES